MCACYCEVVSFCTSHFSGGSYNTLLGDGVAGDPLRKGVEQTVAKQRSFLVPYLHPSQQLTF